MIPIIQFDPATMSLWYDVALISNAGDTAIMDAVSEVVSGSRENVFEELDRISDPKVKARALQIVSAFWHEKRHFLDLISTNYGAFRFRQFLEVYVNLAPVIQTGKSVGKLFCPLEIYDDPVRRAVMGIDDVPPHFAAIAEMLKRRRKMVEKDREASASRFGSIELGGEAQLEAMAYLAQSRFLQIFFGTEASVAFRESVYNLDGFMNKYFSVIEAATRIGLVPAEQIKPGLVSIDTTLLECVVFASLQSDHLPRSLSGDKPYIETSYPAERFAALAVHLRNAHPSFKTRKAGEISFAESWQIVNDACVELFGQSVADQAEADVDHFEKQLGSKIYGNVPEEIERMAKDYFGLRRKALRRLRETPADIVSTEMFVIRTERQIIPNYVICTSQGVIGDPPDGFDRLMGYEEKDRDHQEAPYLKWWWACSPKLAPEPISPKDAAYDLFKLDHPKAWYSCIDFYSPTAKLLMNGRRIRTMLGPELMFAQQRLENQFGIKTEIYPSFEFPEETIDAAEFYFYYGTETLKCDFSSQVISKPKGKVITPWTMRRWPRLAQRAIEHMGGHEIAYYSFVRDWSPWVVTEDVYEELAPLMS